MDHDEDIPVGERLGSQRLYAVTDAPVWEGEPPPFSNPPPIPAEAFRYDAVYPEPERTDMPAPPERKDLPKPVHDPRKPAKPPHQAPKEQPPALHLPDVNWGQFGSTCLEIAGVTAITAGSWMIRAWLGLLVLGLCLILLGIATGIQRRE